MQVTTWRSFIKTLRKIYVKCVSSLSSKKNKKAVRGYGNYDKKSCFVRKSLQDSDKCLSVL